MGEGTSSRGDRALSPVLLGPPLGPGLHREHLWGEGAADLKGGAGHGTAVPLRSAGEFEPQLAGEAE